VPKAVGQPREITSQTDQAKLQSSPGTTLQMTSKCTIGHYSEVIVEVTLLERGVDRLKDYNLCWLTKKAYVGRELADS